MVVKSLAHKPHLSSKYWGMAYSHSADLHNITSGPAGSSPYSLWHGRPYDLERNPILPFGSIVAAHKSLTTQTALSGRSIEAVFVGIAHDHAAAVNLFNPITKKTFIRHSFIFV